MVFERLKQKFKTLMPISDQWRARIAFSLVNNVVNYDEDIKKIVPEIEEAKKIGNIKKVQKGYEELIELFKKVEESLDSANKEVFTLEYKLLRQIKDVEVHLKKIEQPELTPLINQLNSLMSNLKSKIGKERRISVDLSRGGSRWREIRLSPKETMENSLLTHARAERRIVKPIKRLIEYIDRTCDELKSGKVKTDKKIGVINKLTQDVKKLEPLLSKEISYLIAEEDKILILAFRFRIENEEFFNDLLKLVKQGFPQVIAQSLAEKNQREVLNELKKKADEERRISTALQKVA